MFGNELYMNYDYLDSGRSTGISSVHQFVVAIDDAAHATALRSHRQMFANSSNETTTLNEREWVRSSVSKSATCRLSSTTSSAPYSSRCCS